MHQQMPYSPSAGEIQAPGLLLLSKVEEMQWEEEEEAGVELEEEAGVELKEEVLEVGRREEIGEEGCVSWGEIAS